MSFFHPKKNKVFTVIIISFLILTFILVYVPLIFVTPAPVEQLPQKANVDDGADALPIFITTSTATSTATTTTSRNAK